MAAISAITPPIREISNGTPSQAGGNRERPPRSGARTAVPIAASPRPPTPVEQIARAAASPEAAPPAGVPAPPTAAAVPARVVTPAVEAPAPVVSDAARIREILHAYERAMNTLDIDLYVRVFPSFSGERKRRLESAWKGLRSQHVELEIRQIESSGSQARIRAYQNLLAAPLVGSEQRDSREQVFSLENRGGTWVITAVN
jgi:hypothetical protein